MYTQYEDKGKIFTQKITKEQKEVIIQTTSQKITGTIHIQMDNRIIDQLNETNQFLAITNAKIMDKEDNVLYFADFLSINVNQIVWVLPIEDKINK